VPEVFHVDSVEPRVRGYLHAPASRNGAGLLLTHGAGSNSNAPLLVALAETFSAARFTVLRCDLPYRQARSWGPPGPADAARDRAGLKNALEALKKHLGSAFLASSAKSGDPLQSDKAGGPPNAIFVGDGKNEGAPPNATFVGWESRIFLGGHSYGGRQSSMLCAELSDNESNFVSGLLLLSYPLHPPRKPDQQRTQHLPNLRKPSLFIHGTRDPFGSTEELEQALKMIPAKTRLVSVEGAGHDLGFKGKTKQEALPTLVFSEFTKFFELSS
jgi:uncharacterized protein